MPLVRKKCPAFTIKNNSKYPYRLMIGDNEIDIINVGESKFLNMKHPHLWPLKGRNIASQKGVEFKMWSSGSPRSKKTGS